MHLEAPTTQQQAITLSPGLQTHAQQASSMVGALEVKATPLEGEQPAAHILSGHPAKSNEPKVDVALLIKSELMRKMERR